MNVPFRVSLINAHARSGRPVLGDRAGAAAFAAGLKATVLAVEEVQSPSNPQETEIMYVVTFDQPEYWIRRGLNELSSLTKRWPASFFNTIEDDGVRPPGYVDHNIGDGQNRQADTGGRRRKTRKRKGGIRFRKGQLVEIKWPNRDGSFNWWKARIIADNGGPTIIVHWLGLLTPDGFPLHEEIQRPPRSHVRILSRGGRKKRKTRKKKGGITPAEFNFQRFKAERFEESLKKCREREKELQVALASASTGKQLPAELEKNVTSFMGGGRDLCEQGYGPSEEEFQLLQRTIRKQIDEGELPEHLVELDGYGRLDMLMTINNVANDYCYRLKGRGAYCDQTTAKCKKQIQHRQNGGHHLYKRLGVSKYASQKQIRKAFKTLKKKRKANKKVREAYKILSNKKTRKQYNNRYRKMKRNK